jgi:hypothetical protein
VGGRGGRGGGEGGGGVSYGYAQWRMGAKRRAENCLIFCLTEEDQVRGETEELENKKKRKGKEETREK